jgi:hypothetical protein
VRGQVFASFHDLYFPRDTNIVSNVDFWQFLISGFASLPKKTEMLEKAITAVSCLYLGKMKGDKRLFYYGLQLYTDAIRLLLNAIYRGSHDNEIIYTTVIFQEIEVIASLSLHDRTVC